MFVHGKRREELAKFAPYARFQIPVINTIVGGIEYGLFLVLCHLCEDFGRWACPTSMQTIHTSYEEGMEGGIGGMIIDGQYAGTAKLFIYAGKNSEGWQGIIIRDHLDLGPEKVDDVFRIADKFGEYLNEKGIPFERFNMKFPERQEVLVK